MLKRFRPALRPVSRQLSGLARLAGANGGAARCFSTASLPPFEYEELFQSTGPLGHPFRKLTSDHVSTLQVAGKQVLQVEPEALRLLSSQAMTDIAHLLRPGHLQQLANILDDPEVRLPREFHICVYVSVCRGELAQACANATCAQLTRRLVGLRDAWPAYATLAPVELTARLRPESSPAPFAPGVCERPLRRTRAAEECVRRGWARAAGLSGHGNGDCDG